MQEPYYRQGRKAPYPLVCFLGTPNHSIEAMKFFVTYQMPHTGLDEWMKLPEEERKAQEQQMQSEWNDWMEARKASILESAGVGKPKRITSSGIEDSRNDLMMYSFVEAESLDAAAAMFENHPHFGIPGAWIEVMPVSKDIS